MERRRSSSASAAVLAALLLVVAAACAGAPQAVLTVPGSYTFGPVVSLEPDGLHEGPPGGTVLLCVATRSALLVETSWDAGMSVNFDGVTQYGGPAYSWTTAPVGPGCGTLTAAAASTAEGSLRELRVVVTGA